jgi:hypothetical protein
MNLTDGFPGKTVAHSRRRALAVGASGAVALAAAYLAPPGLSQPQPPRRVSLRDFGGRGDGRSDETRAFQRACDALSGGGSLEVPPGTYWVDRVIVRHRGIRVALADGAVLRKSGQAGPESRGIFELDGLHDAAFELRGGGIDLNGEGPQGIGAAGRIRNLYAPHTVATVVGIAGPVNAAVFARRSSGIAVRDCTIRNSGENGLLFRNCGAVEVHGCRFENLANWGIEYSFVAGNRDGGSGPRPRVGGCAVSGCSFQDIDDLALGTGNGVGIGGGGARGMGAFRDYRISDCSFLRCKGDIHFEFEQGSWIDGLTIARVRSTEARQGSLGLISVRNALVEDYTVIDPGAAAFALLIPERPEVFGIALSSGFDNVTLRNVTVRDTRSGRQVGGGGLRASRGGARAVVPSGPFVAADEGAWIGIAGANPRGVAYLGKVRRVISPREVELDPPVGAGVAAARFALGGATRNGIILTAGEDVAFDNVAIEAGAAADPASRAEAAAIRMYKVGGRVSFERTTIRAPSGRGEKAVGIRISDSTAELTGLERTTVSGYASRVARIR